MSKLFESLVSKYGLFMLIAGLLLLCSCEAKKAQEPATDITIVSASSSSSTSSSSGFLPKRLCSEFPPSDLNNGSSLMISEVVVKSDNLDSFNGNDWVELKNTGSLPICLGVFTIKDSNSEQVRLPNVALLANEFFVIQTKGKSIDYPKGSLPFNLAKDDEISLYAKGEKIDTLSWHKGDAKKGSSFGLLNGVAQTLYPTPNNENVAYRLFTDDNVFTVKIQISDKKYKDLLRRPIAERWYKADLEFNGAVISDVGIRTKGSSTLKHVARLKKGHKSYGRYSFKINFDKFKQQKFMGMKSLVFNNSYGDPTLMRDGIAYHLMKAVGVPASEHSYVDLWIADKHLGLYQMIEPIDGEYIEKYFPDDKSNGFKGDLYKAFSSLEWQPGQTLNDYTKGHFPDLELKTNKESLKTDEKGKALMAFLKSINSGSADLIDTDNMVRYIAAMTLISNYDSYFANKGNYYLYEHRSINAFAMLPWDFNLGLGRSIKKTKKCSDDIVYIDHPTIPPLEQRPIVARILERDDLKKKYHEHLNHLLSNIFNPKDMRSYIQQQRALIEPYVKNDPTSFYSYDEWNKSFTENVLGDTDYFGLAGALIPFVDARYDNVRRQLSGEIPSSNGDDACPYKNKDD